MDTLIAVSILGLFLVLALVCVIVDAKSPKQVAGPSFASRVCASWEAFNVWLSTTEKGRKLDMARRMHDDKMALAYTKLNMQMKGQEVARKMRAERHEQAKARLAMAREMHEKKMDGGNASNDRATVVDHIERMSYGDMIVN